MEKALAIVLALLVLTAFAAGFTTIVAIDATSRVGHRVLKEVIHGAVTLCQPIWVWSRTLEHWVFKGIERIYVPWEYPIYETVTMPKVAGGEVFWLLAAFFWGLFFIATVVFADQLGVLGITKVMTIAWILIAVGLAVSAIAGILFASGLLLILAAAYAPLIVLGLVISLILKK